MKNNTTKNEDCNIISRKKNFISRMKNFISRMKDLLVRIINRPKESYKRMNSKDKKSLHALVILCVFDSFFALWTYCESSIPDDFLSTTILSCSYLDVFLWILIIVLACLCVQRYLEKRRGMDPVIMTKLLSNAIAPRKLGIAYLFIFVLHIGWLTNITYDILKQDCPSCLPLLVALGGILILVLFFPDAKFKNRDKLKKIYISGISTFRWNPEIDRMNIVPLVRMITSATVDDLKGVKLIILLSNEYTTKPEAVAEIGNMSKLKSNPNKNESKSPNAIDDVQVVLENSISNAYHRFVDKQLSLENLLSEVIKSFAKYILVKDNGKNSLSDEEKEAIDNLLIEFTNPCDYNDYKNCFDTLDKKLDESAQNNDNVQLIFNMTPGNAVVSSVMTLFSVDPDRRLFYHSQDDSVTALEKMKEIDKDRLPILRVLSKTIDKMS